MIEWFFSNWSNSDAFQVGICVAAAVLSSVLISNQRRRIFGALFAGLGLAARTLGSGLALVGKKIGIGLSRAVLGLRSVFRTGGTALAAKIERAVELRSQDWYSELRPSCEVSYVDGLPEDRVMVCRGRVAWIRNGEDALIDWEGGEIHPYTGELGPEHEPRSAHDADLILKENRIGDRGVTYDEAGTVYLSPGWSILSWPSVPIPLWLRAGSFVTNLKTGDRLKV